MQIILVDFEDVCRCRVGLTSSGHAREADRPDYFQVRRMCLQTLDGSMTQLIRAKKRGPVL
jgi:hypothetical protein